MRSDFICLVRQKRFPCVICEEPAEWLWEVALAGVPDSESGMIVSLPEIDLFLSDRVCEFEDTEIKEPHVWLRNASLLVQERFGEKRITCRWQKFISDKIEYTFSL